MTPRRVLFVCIGNSCRSQMAEGFARAYGSDVIEASSAGLSPAGAVSPLTRKIMMEKNIDIAAQFPKELDAVKGPVDLIVNMSGEKMPERPGVEVKEWKVFDPIGSNEGVFREVANEIEQHVMRLIIELRARDGGDRTPPRRRGSPAVSVTGSPKIK